MRPLGTNRLLAFRGQKGKYNQIVPTIHRLTQRTRVECNHAFSWFSAAISAWHNTHFRYLNGIYDSGGVEHDSALGVAQHYQLPTFLVDWTWDPLIALAFAMWNLSEGEEGVVFLRDFGDGTHPTDQYNVLLPPQFAKRAWRQRALFSWHPVSPDQWSDPVVRMLLGDNPRQVAQPEKYFCVRFPATSIDIEWAKRRYHALMEDDRPKLGDLAAWCLRAARNGTPGPVQPRVLTTAEFENRCYQYNVDLPEFVVASRGTFATEDVSLTMDYIDQMAVRCDRNDGSMKYFIPSLLTACVGMPFYSWMKWPKGKGDNLKDPRAAVFFNDGEPQGTWWHDKLRRLNSFRENDTNWLRDAIQTMFIERAR